MDSAASSAREHCERTLTAAAQRIFAAGVAQRAQLPDAQRLRCITAFEQVACGL